MKKKKLLKRIEELENIIEQKVFKYLHPPILSDLENMKYHPDPILFNKYCKECKLKQELTPASEVINLDDNIFDIKARPTIGVKRFSNLVDRI